MPRFRLRTLLILLAIGPPMLAMTWLGVMAIIDHYRPAPAVGWGWQKQSDDPEFRAFIDKVIEAETNPTPDDEFPNLQLVTE